MGKSNIGSTRLTIFFLLGALAVVGLILWMMQTKPQPSRTNEDQIAYSERVGLPVSMTNSVGIAMNLIPPGEFQMGSPKHEFGRTTYEFPHTVQVVRPFYIGVTEVTQAQYMHVTGENPSFFTNSLIRPVEQVSWYQALEYCNKLSEMENLDPVYTKSEDGNWNCNLDLNGYRLPAEAEWEYACRAGTTDAFYTGPNMPENVGLKNLWEAGWFFENSKGSRNVGLLKPNDFGLFDMHGNVAEHVWDIYAPYPVTRVSFLGPESGSQGRVIRGGNWYDKVHECRSASRKFYNPFESRNLVGFRIVRTANAIGSAR